MGQFKKAYFDDFDNEVYNLNTKELVCSHHIKDDYITKYILANGQFARCCYCGKKKKVVELSEVLKLIITGIEFLFEDANESRFYNEDGEHGFDGKTLDFYDLYHNNELGLEINDYQLENDIYEYLKNDQIIYCYRDEFGGTTDYLEGLWYYFKEIVKHKARFVFHYKNTFSNHHYVNPSEILNSVQDYIIELKLFKIVTTKDKLYRCVRHEQINEVEGDGKRIASNPTLNCKSNSRMSPAGISMFYCSPHKDICVSEVVDLSNGKEPYYTVAYFTPIRRLKLVDLTKLPKLPSIFDKDKNKHIETIFFLKAFIRDLSKAIKKGDEIIDYVPTQIVTEYIRYNPDLDVDGIVYFSSKDSLKTNYVLFKDHNQSLKDLIFHDSSKETNHI